MIPYEKFYKTYPHKHNARKKYVTALKKHLSFGGFVSSSSFGSVHSVVLPGQADQKGFVRICEMNECELDATLRSYLVPRSQGTAWQEAFDAFENDMKIDGANYEVVYNNYIRLIEEHFGRREIRDSSTKTPEELNASVYIREGCFSDDVRLPETCEDVQKYFYFGTCGIRTQPIIHYLSTLEPFTRLFPYSYGTFTNADRFPCVKTVTQFLTDDRYTVMCYSVNIEGAPAHLSHMRFAVKDTTTQRLLLFDPHGRFYLTDGGQTDLERFSDILQKIPQENKKMRTVHRSTYKGDQPDTEGSCAMVSVMRAMYIASHPDLPLEQSLNNPIDCKLPLFLSLLAESFGDAKFKYEYMDDRYLVSVLIQIPDEPDRTVCTGLNVSRFAAPLVNNSIARLTMTVYEALLRAHYSQGLSIQQVNPYMYTLHHHDGRDVSMITAFAFPPCLDPCPEPCFVLRRLPAHTYNVPYQCKHFDRRGSGAKYTQAIVQEDATETVREIFTMQLETRARGRDVIRPGETHDLVYITVPNGTLLDPEQTLHAQHYMVGSFPRPSVCLVYKKRSIRVSTTDVSVGPSTRVVDVMNMFASAPHIKQHGYTLPEDTLVYSTYTEDPYEIVS